MSQAFFDFNLLPEDFPLLQELQVKTTLVDFQSETKTSRNRPSIAYCHNVLPTEYGVTSVAYKQLLPKFLFTNEGEYIVDVRVIYSIQRNRVYMAWSNLGNMYVLPNTGAEWVVVKITRITGTALFSQFSPDLVSIGNVKGQSYIFFKNAACFQFTESTLTLQEIELIGLEVTAILGVVGSYGYLVAYTETSVAWGSIIQANDFTPDGINGAGSGEVSNIAGSIAYCIANSYGFFVYTFANVVAGTYTGNAKYPFKFSEVANSNGATSLDHVAYENTNSFQLAFTKNGLQVITQQEAQIDYPNLTDFLFGRKFDTFNETSMQFETVTIPTGALKKKLKFIAGRYVIISYGAPTDIDFSHALVIDLSLKRLGKLKFKHSDVFEFLYIQTEIAKESIALVQSDGSTYYLDTSNLETGTGVIMLGKFQYSSSRLLQVLDIHAENIPYDYSLAVYDLSMIDNQKVTPKQATLYNTGEQSKSFSLRHTAKLHNLLLVGAFRLTSVTSTYVIAGKR